MFPLTAFGADGSDHPHGPAASSRRNRRAAMDRGGDIAPYLPAESSRPWVVSHDPRPAAPAPAPADRPAAAPAGASEVDGYCAASAASSASTRASTASSVAYSASSTAAIANSMASEA